MNLSKDFIDTLNALTNRIHTTLNDFLDVLKKEKEILKESKFNLLESLSLRKMELHDLLNQYYIACELHFKSINLPLNQSTISKVISNINDENIISLGSTWHEIKNMLTTCSHNNIENGITIAAMRNFNAEFLKIITNQPKENNYNKDAQLDKQTISTCNLKI